MDDPRNDDSLRKHSEHDDRLFRRKDSGNDRRIRTKPEGYTDFDDVNEERDSNSGMNQQGTQQRKSHAEDNWDSRRERDNRRKYDDRHEYIGRDAHPRGNRGSSRNRRDTRHMGDRNGRDTSDVEGDDRSEPRERAEASRRAMSMRSDPESGEDVPKRRKGRGSFAMKGRRTPTPEKVPRRVHSERYVREASRDRGRGDYIRRDSRRNAEGSRYNDRRDRGDGGRRMGVKSHRGPSTAYGNRHGHGRGSGHMDRGGREWDRDRDEDDRRERERRDKSSRGQDGEVRYPRHRHGGERPRDSRERSRGGGYGDHGSRRRDGSMSEEEDDGISDNEVENEDVDVDVGGDGSGAESSEIDEANDAGQATRSVFDRLGAGARDSDHGTAEGVGRSLASRINVRDRLRVGYKSKATDLVGDDEDDDVLEVDSEVREQNRRRALDTRRARRAQDRNAHRVIQSINPDTALNAEPSDFDALLTNVLERVEPESRKFIEARPDCHSASVCRDHALLQYGTDAWTTKDVFDYWTGLDPKFVEWVNDSSVCVVFDSEAKAEAARLATSTAILASDYTETLKITEEYVPEDTRLYWRKGKDYKEWSDILIRFASTSDIKRVGAWKESQFYKQQQQRDRQQSAMALDAELDEIATGDYTATRTAGSHGNADPIFGDSGRGRYERARGGARGRGGFGGHLSAAERQAQLDKELDEFITAGDDVTIENATDPPAPQEPETSEIAPVSELPDEDTEMLMDE